MEKKFEFQPDKPHSGFFSKLYLTRKQRLSLLKWGLYALVLLVLSILQDVIFCRLEIFGATSDLVPCGIFLIGLLVGVENGCVFSLVASLIYLFSGTAPGPYSMVIITVLSTLICLFRQSFLQQGFPAAALCTGAALLFYELATFAIGLFLGLTTLARLPGFCITAVLSALAIPVLYPIATAIGTIGGESWKE